MHYRPKAISAILLLDLDEMAINKLSTIVRDYGPYKDEALFSMMKKGDERAFECIYNRYGAKLYASAYNLLRHQVLCEDLVQELFIDLWNKKHTLTIQSLKPYLYTAMRNKVLMSLRKGRGTLALSAAAEVQSHTQADESIYLTEIADMLREQTNKLPEQCRRIFQLSRQDQFSNKEIAEQLNISVKTVENQISIALHRLRSAFGELF